LNKDYVQKKLVQEAMLDINFDDLQNLLESTSDDKEFVTQALDIFKATINTVLEDSIDKVATAAVEIIQEEATAGIEEKIDELESQYNEFMEDLDANISDYIDAMVLEWYEDNKLAIQDSTKTSIAESFMSDLKNLMIAYSVEVPEESADLYEASLQTGQQLYDEYAELKSYINEVTEAEIIRASFDSGYKYIGIIDSDGKVIKSEEADPSNIKEYKRWIKNNKDCRLKLIK
jgi:biopolymer transport protein ExbB/TolQ